MSEQREQQHREEAFSYTYDAKQQAEIKKIREKYLPREEDKMERLRKLDESVSKKATRAALIMGVVSTLLLGLGMSCCMEFGAAWFLPGIVVGMFGIAGVCAAYPLYNWVVRRERKRVAPEIIRLSDELLK